ncbi:YiiX/YebB-like N1pC/P60 family cysteine hydrolase [Chitinophaga sancti]|uniref:Permuted papain-like amidase enzyme, YaeF/YiiX, C92 family n=1 Tax=Chitinophaga sancti TaxID=1004 RepID=A0A1K1T157_9BACT|nr:YiiX/YebB-like N1pC/P60 family cysteine hydrolase [Chitinophaga sancti]WQD63972.1 YiiX/YebB-like N1pC/P60 family cysteine hydrolase [Chitinophaga sancti]WQG90403.1 YiiX/YebB-like N1pC/P60 family cysteine hydrolase [Chitinophaga sancti]SFW90262.1 Permuted papain-like amidase enzyme, YaeF/YiiX, C92 family [Chitinophaga sancti]
MERRKFIKSIGIVSVSLSNIPVICSAQQLPPLSPQNGGRSILPSLLKTGDILLSTTNQLSSRIIRNQTDLPISHASIVYNTNDANNPEIAEAVSSGVRIISYKDVMKDDTLCVAIRKTNLSNQDIKTLQEWLLTKIGSDYDFGGVFEEWLALKAQWMNNLRSIALGNPKKFYCSELVNEAYKGIGINLLKYNGPYPNRNSAPGRFVELTWFNELDYIGHLKY